MDPQAVNDSQISDLEPFIEFNFMGKAAVKAFSSSDSDSDDSDAEGSDDSEPRPPAASKKTRKANLPRLNEPERMAMENWISKTRSDGLMLNARWIRNGGAKGKSMTATSSEVKTQGAYVALAVYVNKRLSYSPSHPRFWSTETAKRRWKSLYSSYTDAMKEEDKSNSCAGTSNQ